MLKQKRFWLGVLISLAFLVYVFYQTNPMAIGAELARANYIYLLPALALYFIGVAVRAVRWHWLLRSIRAVPARRLFPIVVIGYMANDILPFRLGEVVRAFVLRQQENISTASVLVTIVVERILDGLTMVVFIAAVSFFLPLDDRLRTVLAIGGAAFSGVLVILIVVASLHTRLDPLIAFFTRLLPAHLQERTSRLIASFLHGLSVLRNPADALLAFGASIVAWLFEAGMYVLIGSMFGLAKPLPMYLLATAVGNLAGILPSSPGYVGVFDAPIKYVLTGLYSVEQNLATAYTLFLHAALLLPVTLLGFYYLWRAGLSLTQLSRSDERGADGGRPVPERRGT